MTSSALPATGADRLIGLGDRFTGRGRATLLTGLLMLSLLILVAIFAPLIASHSPTEPNPSDILAGPSGAHFFGTDQYGRDIFARTLYAARIDLLIGAVLVGVAVIIGTTVGLFSGWVGGWLDVILMRIIDIGFAFPFLVLVICMVGLRGPGLGSLFFAVSLVAWVFYARLARGEVLITKQQNYIKAARTSGFSTPRILFRHVLPNVGSQVLLYATSDFVYAVLLGASVSYLGLGVQPPTSEWGAMVQQGQNFVTSQWWISLFPGLAIVYLGIALALLGDGLADILRQGDS